MRKEWRKGERGKENKEQAGVFLGSFRKGYMWMLRIWKRIPFTCPCLPPGLHKSSSEIFDLKNCHAMGIGGISFASIVPEKPLLWKENFKYWMYWTFRFGGQGTFFPKNDSLWLLNEHVFCICYPIWALDSASRQVLVWSMSQGLVPEDSTPHSGLGAAKVFARWVNLDSLYSLTWYISNVLIYANLSLSFQKKRQRQAK